jgi:PPP family 3-phenylpropionic acid transporter
MKPLARVALQYVLLFGATGVSLPFAGLWLRAQGLSGAQIGVLLAAPMLARVITGPAVAIWADGFRLRRTPLAILGLVAALGYGAAGLVEGIVAWAACWFVAATAAAALIPLIDVLNLRVSRREGFAFAVPRGFGSAAFVLANLAMGALLTRMSADVVIVWCVAACLLIALTAWRVLPADPVSADGPATGPERFKGMGRLVLDPVFVLAVLAIGAVQASHAFYYAFSAVVWQAQGVSPAMTGALWGFSVVVEIGFMWGIEPWRRRLGIGPWPVLMLGAAAAVLRWTVMAGGPPTWSLWPLQTLHALTFAATYLAGVEIVERLAPANDQTAAQSLNAMLASGLLTGLATLAAGPLHDAGGAWGWLAMAGLALAGGAAAMVLRPALTVG